MLMKLFSLILAAVMSITSIPVTGETALKINDAVNSAVEWVTNAFSSSGDAEDNSASSEAVPETETSNDSDTSAEEDYEVSEQAMDDERDPTDGKDLKAFIRGSYKQEDSWGHVNTEARIDNYFEIYGLHEVSNTAQVTVNLPSTSGDSKTYRFGSKSSGLTGTFYYDINNRNDIGKNYGVTDFSSLGVYVQNKAQYSQSRVVKISSSSFTMTPSSLTINATNSSATASPSFSSSSSASGTTKTVTYSFEVEGYVRDESSVHIYGGTSMSVKYVHVNTFALWNLYVAEANTGAGTSKRASYKASYTAADASAWNKYEEALVAARMVLCGGVPQTEINASYNNLRQAVLNLKIRGQFKTTGCTNSVAPYYFNVNLFKDIVTPDDRATAAPTYTYNTITPTTPAGCWLDAERLEKTGYAFKQWKRFRSYNSSTVLFDNAGANAKYTFILQDTYTTPVVFEPTWEALTYTINFDANIPTGDGFIGELMGGVDTRPITITWEDQSQVYPSCMWLVHKELPDGTLMQNYMKFRAWSKEPDSAAGYTNLPGNLIYASDFFEGTKDEDREITLYALWKNNVGSVTLDFNYSGTISDIKDYQMKPLTSRTVYKAMVLNTTWALNVNPYKTFYREGYDFTGWHKDPNMPSLDNSATPTDENPEITRYAQWEKKAFYINADINGGVLTDEYTNWLSDTVDSQNIIKIDDIILRVCYGTSFILPDSECVKKTGYSFIRWELNGVEYQPGTQVVIPDYGQTATTVQLKAIWQRNTTSFTLHYNNGQDDVTFSGLYGDTVPEDYAEKFTPDTTEMNDFYASNTSWYTRSENADGTYTYSPYRQTTTFPAESVELYCGWSMKRLTQAVCNDCNGKMGISDYVRVNKDTKSLDFLFLERDVELYPDGKLYYYTEESRNGLTEAFNVAKQYLTDFSPNSTKNLMFDYSLKEEIEQAAVGIYDALNQMAFNPADYSRVEAQIVRINQIREGTFTYEQLDFSIENCGIDTFTASTWRAVETAEAKVKYGYLTTNQAQVDIFASNIDEAISGLIIKSGIIADYTAVEEAKAKIPADLSIYTDETIEVLNEALASVVEGLEITEQSRVNEFAAEIEAAVIGLILKAAEYTAVEAAKAKIPADLTLYTDETVAELNAAVEAVVYDLDITKQSEVDAYATTIESAIRGLELKKNSENPQYEISKEKGRAGEEVEVYISIKNNPGIISLRNSISYDTTALELVGVENLGLLKGYTNPSTTISSPYILRWADSLALENNTSDGEFVKLIFKIKENTEVGDYEISVNPIESRTFNGEKITFEAATSSITVIDYIVGDIDNDGEITDWDSIILNRYLAGWDVTIDILESADIDKDGEITDWDSIMLERYLSGWDIVLEK